MLVIHGLLLAWTAYVYAPTRNEPAHLAAGMSIWQLKDFAAYRVNPPLVKLIAAVPVLLSSAATDWHSYGNAPGVRPEFQMGDDFLGANRSRFLWLLTSARWACLPFAILGGYVCFAWARELYGVQAGVIALALWCFCPTILSHGALITTDVPAAALGVAACYHFWQWLKQPSWLRAATAGLLLGAAELTKTTLVIFYALWPLQWALSVRSRGPAAERPSSASALPSLRQRQQRQIVREGCMLALQLLCAVYLTNVAYGFAGSCTRLADYRFFSKTLGGDAARAVWPRPGGNRFSGMWLGTLPLPLPRHYVEGIDLQNVDCEGGGPRSYLRGCVRDRGWWYYYLYAMAIKVPLGTWAVLGIAFAQEARRRLPVGHRQRGDVSAERSGQWDTPAMRDTLALLLPAGLILIVVSSQTGFTAHMRYALPAFPFLFIWGGRAAVAFRPGGRPGSAGTGWKRVMSRCMQRLIAAALTWSSVSTLCVYPHSLSYFNELVGGPRRGGGHLMDSNYDWGQDLLFLKAWLEKHPECTPLRLAYFGCCDPQLVGLEYSGADIRDGVAPDETDASHAEAVGRGIRDVPRLRMAPGYYAVSEHFVRGLPSFAYDGHGAKVSYRRGEFMGLQALEPIGKAGYAISMYRITR